MPPQRRRTIPPSWVPVKDRNGKVVGYTDSTGMLVGDKNGNPLGSPFGGLGGGSSADQEFIRERNRVGVDPEASAERTRRENAERKQREDKAKAERDQKAQAEKDRTLAGAEKIWLDGHLVTVKRNPDGSWTTTPIEGGKGSPVLPPTAFDALDGNALEPTAPFLMSWRLGTGGKQVTIGNMLQQLELNKNMMTVGGAAGWLATLSTKDPAAYQTMLEKLHSAAYLSDADLASANGKWSSAAGTAFALAARDVAVVNTTAEGQNITLGQFLDSKQGAYQAQQAQAYKPVERQYTDPEDIKAAAKSEAESFLGRQLSDAEENQLVIHYRGLEDAMFDTIDAAGHQGKNATFTKPGSGQIDHFVEDTPATAQEGANFRAGQYGQALKRLFGVATGG